jgi:signal transduction histidine kinase
VGFDCLDGMNWIKKTRQLGVIQDSQNESQRRIAFSNVVFITLPAVYLIFILIDVKTFLVPPNQLVFDQFIVPIVIGICIFCLWLNYVGRTTFSRVLFIVLWPLLMHIIPIIKLNAPSDYALAFPFGIVFHGMLIQLLFSYKSEKKLFWFFLFINCCMMILAPRFLVMYDSDLDVPQDLVLDKFYFLVGILYWLLFNLVTFYILNVIEAAMKRLIDSKALITEQKNKLNELNHHLEELVAQRTQLLEEQNEKLRQHAFFNAHLLRSPFSNIQGLVQMQYHLENDSRANTEEIHEIRQKLKDSIDELDMRIIEIQKLVETSN